MDVIADDVSEIDVSVVLPVYNEAANIEQEISRIRAGLDGVAIPVMLGEGVR